MLRLGHGNEGIAKALNNPPDVIVLDLVMPRLDGWRTMKLLRTYATTREIAVVACTGASEDGLTMARMLGCNAIARKACSPEVVEAMVREVFASEPEASDAG